MDPDPPSSNQQEAGKGTPDPLPIGPHGRIFHGWWIVAAATVAQTIQSAIFNIGAQALVLPLIREFDATRTAVSVAFSLRRLEGGLTGPLEGYLIHWIGPRKYMMVGWVIFGVGFILCGLSQNTYHFYASFLLITLGQSVAGFLPIVTVLIHWFDKWRGRAIAIYQLGTSFGALLVPLFAWSILNIGWRQTLIAVGISTILLGVPLASAMKEKPEDLGLLPDGARTSPDDKESIGTEQSESNANVGNESEEIGVGQHLRGRNFWFLGLAHSAGITGWGALQVHQIPALVDIGINELTAATILSYTLVVSAAGRLLGGFLGDLIGTKKVCAIAFIFQALAIVILAYASSSAHVMWFATIFGVAFGTRGTLMTVLRAEVFGRQHFSRLAGLMDPLSGVSVVISPIFAGLAYDSIGAFLILAALNASGALFLMGINLKSKT